MCGADAVTEHGSLHGSPVPFERERLAVSSPDAAVALLGAILLREERDGRRLLVRVVETEAYRQDDAASHSFSNRSPRTEPMFWRPGTTYAVSYTHLRAH